MVHLRRRAVRLLVEVAVVGLLIPTLMLLVIIACSPLWTPGSCASPCDGPPLLGTAVWVLAVPVGWVTYLVYARRRRTTPVAAVLAALGKRMRSQRES